MERGERREERGKRTEDRGKRREVRGKRKEESLIFCKVTNFFLKSKIKGLTLQSDCSHFIEKKYDRISYRNIQRFVVLSGDYV